MRLALAALLVVTLIVPFAAGPADAGPSTAKKTAGLIAKLKKQRLSNVKFEEEALEKVVVWLRTATGENFHIKKAALEKAGIDLEDIVVTATLKDVTVATFLKLILEPHELAAVVKGNVVYLTTKKDSYGKPITRLYGISHITWTKIDFIAPEMNLTHPDDVGEEYTPEVEVEDDPLNNGDAVAELVKELIPGWDENDEWSITATDQYMVIKAPKSIHKCIPGVLDKISSMK